MLRFVVSIAAPGFAPETLEGSDLLLLLVTLVIVGLSTFSIIVINPLPIELQRVSVISRRVD